jgi:hypothetical protein
MRDFSKAEVADEGTDLAAYRAFLERVSVGQTVTLPLETGETPRQVMRRLNAAARGSNRRLARLPPGDGAVRFRVVPTEKRAVRLTDEARRARAEKARATRTARRAERERRQATGTATGGAGAGGAAAPRAEGGPSGPPRERPGQEPDVQRPPRRGSRPRRPGAA